MEEELTRVYVSRRKGEAAMAESVRHCVWSRKLDPLSHQLQTENRETKLEVGPGYELSKTLPTYSRTAPSCQAVPPTGDYVFNYLSLWSHSHSNNNTQTFIHTCSHEYTSTALCICRTAIINATAIESFISDLNRDSFEFLALLQVTQKLRRCHKSSN